MFLNRFIKNKEKAKRFAHIIAGVTILLHSLSHYQNNDPTYKLFFFAGLIFLTIAIFHPIIEKKAPWIDGVFFAIEGLLSLFVAYEFFHLGKKAIPFVYLLVGISQVFLAFIFSFKGIKQHKKLSSKENMSADL
jgi:hypothetical protein